MPPCKYSHVVVKYMYMYRVMNTAHVRLQVLQTQVRRGMRCAFVLAVGPRSAHTQVAVLAR